MGKDFKIGIIYNHDSNWIGGTYYIENLINSLNKLNYDEQPEIVILSNKEEDFFRIKTISAYSKLSYFSTDFNLSFTKRIINKIFKLMFNRSLFSKRLDKVIDVVFPNPFGLVFGDIKKKVWWLPDFQHFHLSNLFSREEIKRRNEWFAAPSKTNAPLILSSQSALADYKHFFPHASNPVFVLPFAVTVPDLGSNEMIQSTKNKFGIKRPFFLCSNQFWVHKNHLVVLKAIRQLKDHLPALLVVFTGKEYDPRNPNYTSELKEYVVQNSISNNVMFLGFIDRIEQLRLMKLALGIIQPSLFEGWSTVIEDAKALNKKILASSLPVNIEQLTEYPSKMKFFFEAQNESQLALLIQSNNLSENGGIYNYDHDIVQFAKKFKVAMEEIRK